MYLYRASKLIWWLMTRVIGVAGLVYNQCTDAQTYCSRSFTKTTQEWTIVINGGRAPVVMPHWMSSRMYIKGYSVRLQRGLHHFMDNTHREPPPWLVKGAYMRREVPLERPCLLSELEQRGWPKVFWPAAGGVLVFKRHQSPPGLWAGRRHLVRPPNWNFLAYTWPAI